MKTTDLNRLSCKSKKVERPFTLRNCFRLFQQPRRLQKIPLLLWRKQGPTLSRVWTTVHSGGSAHLKWEITLLTQQTCVATYVGETHSWPDIFQHNTGLGAPYVRTHAYASPIASEGSAIIGWGWAWNSIILFTCPEPGPSDTHTQTPR